MRWSEGRALCLALLLALGAGAALAGPAEDFAAAARIYASGDVVGAMPGLRRAADAGHAPAQVLLAEILDRSEFDEEAVAYYRKAVAQGSADGQFGLGTMYSNGEGVKKDLAEARRLITLAAEQGHKQAIAVLAQAYIGGKLGIDEAERKGESALRWIALAADNDYLIAIDVLAQAYRNGDYGLTADPKTADQLLAKANKLRNLQPGGKKGKNKDLKK